VFIYFEYGYMRTSIQVKLVSLGFAGTATLVDHIEVQYDNCFNSLVGIYGAAIIASVKFARKFRGQRPLAASGGPYQHPTPLKIWTVSIARRHS
jgi:hypothetical protein